MKERPILFSAPMVRALLAGTKTQTRRIVKPQPPSNLDPALVSASWDAGFIDVKCRYGVPGDRLWVKEAIRRTEYGAEFIADGAPTKADCWPWKNKALPSIHMPRGLSRITLEVSDVRVQRLQDISEEDARAEGVDPVGDAGPIGYRDQFALLWEQINGADSWRANPWVWVISFKPTHPSTKEPAEPAR